MDALNRFSPFWAAFLASIGACAFTGLGVFLMSRHKRVAQRQSIYFRSFAAGLLIAISFVHVIPRAFAMQDSARVWLLAGFLAIYALNRFVQFYLCPGCDRGESGDLTSALGIGIHSFVDGVIYSVTFSVSMFTGVSAAVGMILHEFSEGVVTFVMLERTGLSRRQAIIYAMLAAGLSTPLGMLVSFPFIGSLRKAVQGSLLAVSAGALVYVGASHLLPAVERERRQYTWLPLASGVLMAVLIIVLRQ